MCESRAILHMDPPLRHSNTCNKRYLLYHQKSVNACERGHPRPAPSTPAWPRPHHTADPTRIAACRLSACEPRGIQSACIAPCRPEWIPGTSPRHACRLDRNPSVAASCLLPGDGTSDAPRGGAVLGDVSATQRKNDELCVQVPIYGLPANVSRVHFSHSSTKNFRISQLPDRGQFAGGSSLGSVGCDRAVASGSR